MRQYLKSTVAFGMAFSMLAAPVALAQQDQHNGGGQHDQHSASPPQHSASQSHAAVQHQSVQHQPVQHETMQHQTTQNGSFQHNSVQHQTMQHQAVEPQRHQQEVSSHHWQHGQHYDGDRRVVGNWQYYHLRQPPQGYEWVQDGSQFVLIAVASGIIADVLLNSAYQ